MNKQELIDKAIDDLGGDFDNVTDNLGRFLWVCSDVYQALSSDLGRKGMYICTIEEFNTRKQEREVEGFKPKVGELCEVRWGMKIQWEKCVLIIGGNSLLINDEGERNIDSLDDIEFRPIKSERDIVIDRACEVALNKTGYQDHILVEAMHELYDEGMLTLPK